PPQEKKRFEDDISGNFSGVGMELGMKDGILTVISPLPDSPAKKAGILAGDKVLKIDEKITANLSTDEAVNLIRGEKGTSVHFVLARDKVSKPIEVTVIRDTITIPTLETKKLEPENIFVIKLYNFSAPSADLFRQALRDFINAKTDKLISQYKISMTNNNKKIKITPIITFFIS
ncbi:MAG: PDZ domain-containing protein, partial [Candidatus Vogelbacteria bacterium]|nr:PDZ domain-containing protein [Candidatus Vogelbacteria bacterium]